MSLSVEKDTAQNESINFVSEKAHDADPDSCPSSSGVDEALKVLDGASETVSLTPERERALLWKIGV
jgi:hypothetical protein